MAHPIDAFVPSATHSPVVALLSEHGEPIRRGFFSILTALPVFGLMNLAGFGVVGGILAAGLVAIIGLAGQLGIAVALAWIGLGDRIAVGAERLDADLRWYYRERRGPAAAVLGLSLVGWATGALETVSKAQSRSPAEPMPWPTGPPARGTTRCASR